MKKIGEGISVNDIRKASNVDLLALLDEIVHRNNIHDKDNDDTILYQQVKAEISLRLKPDGNANSMVDSFH